MTRVLQGNFRNIILESVAIMIATPLRLGDFVDTVAYLVGTKTDGARYKIVPGGTGIADGINYIDLDNGLQAEKIHSSVENIEVDGYNNIAVGQNVLFPISSGYANNVAMGENAMIDAEEPSSCVAIGTGAIKSGYDPTNAVAIGYQSMFFDDGSNDNTAVGYESLYSNEDGSNLVAIGSGSLYNSVSSIYNTAAGYRSLYSLNDGESNCAYGERSLYSSVSDSRNTAIGYRSGYTCNGGDDNFYGGYQAGYGNSVGNNNVHIGAFAAFAAGAQSNQVAVGKDVFRLQGGGADDLGVGYQALYNQNNVGFAVTAIGTQALYTAQSIEGTVAVGYRAGYAAAGDNCVYIGYRAGYNNNSDDRLYISNSDTASPLIFGEFGLGSFIEINGDFKFNPSPGYATTQTGEVTFAVPNNTTLRAKYRGTDGVERYVDLTLIP